MKKALKIVGIVLAVMVALVVLAVLTMPLWSGPVVTGVANCVVPRMTKTGFEMGGFSLNPFTGRLSIEDTRLQNPERFFTSSQKEAEEGESALGAVARVAGNAVAAVGDTLASSETNALSFGEISVDLSMMSAMSGAVHVEDVLVRDLFVYGDLTFSNIREIVDNLSGGEKEGEDEPEEKKEEESGEGGDVVIDHLLITGMKIQWGHAVVPIPDIELKDVGRKDDESGESAADQILDAVCDAADKASAGLGTALKAAVKGTKAVGRAIGDAAGAAADAAGAATDAARNAAGAATDAARNAAGAVTDAAKGAVDAVGSMFK